MGLRTPLYEAHLRRGAKLVDFGGWDMPLAYGSQLEEHRAVRRDAGVFDVSHMGVLDLEGARVREFLRYLLANDVARLRLPGKALYTCMLRDDGGILDDLLAYFLDERSFRLVVNAGTRRKDVDWIAAHARTFAVEVRERADLAMLAVQGPNARARTAELLAAGDRQTALALPPFTGAPLGTWFVSRTGYTGEDGFEIILPQGEAVAAWEALLAAGVAPAGLGARDTLRLEAGMNLYGSDMDESRHPLESGLEWTVAFEPWDRGFIGRAALEGLRANPGARLVGLVLEERGVLRAHQRVFAPADSPGDSLGEITSGTFSPTLNRAIALARLRPAGEPWVRVDIRGKGHRARIVRPPFVRHGCTLISL